MNRRLNVKLLLGLSVGTLVVAVGVYFLREHNVKRNASGLLKRAAEAKGRGELSEAVKLHRRYWNYRPDDREQLANLALYMKEMTETDAGVAVGDLVDTYRMIEGALLKLRDADESERNRDLEEKLRRASTDFAMRYGRWTDAIDHLEYLIAAQGEKAEPELAVKLARCYVVNGDRDKSIEVISKLVGFDPITARFDTSTPAAAPHELDAYYLLAVIYRIKELKFETAETILDRMIEVNPDASQAYLKRCDYWRAVGDSKKEQARADIQKALELGPDDADVLVTAAELDLDAGNLQQAKAYLDHGVEKHADDPRIYRLLAAWSAKEQDYDRASRYVDEGLGKAPGNIDLVWYRANLELEMGQVDRAEKSLADLEKMQAPAETLALLSAHIAMAKREWLRASEQLEKARLEVNQLRPEMVSLYDRGLAQCYEMLGQYDKMLTAYENLRQAKPDDQPTVWGLIGALRLVRRVDEAAGEYARLQRDLARRQEAMDTRFLPTHLELTVDQQLQRPQDQRDWTEVDALMDRIDKDASIADVVKVKLKVNLLKVKGDTEGADQLIERAQETHRDDLSLRLAAVDELYQDQGLAAALAQMDTLEQEFGDRVAIRAARARLIVRGGGPGTSAQLRSLEENIDQYSADDKIALWWTLAPYYYALEDRDNARRLFHELVQAHPQDINAQLALCDLAREMNDESQVSATMADLQRLIGTGRPEYKAAEVAEIIWRVRRGMMGRESLARARNLLTEARQARPSWEKLDRLEAEVCLLDEDPDSAVAVLERAISSGQSNPAILQQLVRLLYQLERYEQATRVLDRLPMDQRTPEDHRIARALKGESDGSLDDMEVRADSTNPEDHLADAQRLVLANRWDEAEQALRRAIATGPTQTNTWLSMVRYLVVRGRSEDAEDVIRQAQLHVPEYVVPILSGQCYELLGDREQALQSYMRAYHVHPTDLATLRALASFYLRGRETRNLTSYERRRQTEQADQTLRELVDEAERGGTPTNPHATWARRERARLLAAGGRYREYLAALEVLEKNAGPDGQLASDDLAMWASLSGTRQDAASRNRAIQRLEQAQERRALTRTELLILAELYETTNQKWDRCRQIMQSLVDNNPKDLDVLNLWVRWLLERDATDEVQKVLEKLPPEELGTKMIRVRLLARQGQTAEMKKVLRSLLPDASADANQKALAYLELAKLSEELAKYDKALLSSAETLYERFAKLQPAGKLVQAAFLGRRGKIDEAFRLCGQAMDDQPVDADVQTA